MKKIIMLFVLMISFDLGVKALDYDTYYSEYGSYSDFSEEKVISSDLVDVDSGYRYRWYKNVEDGKYLKLEDGSNSYEHVDSNNYIFTDFSEWTRDAISSDDTRVVESRTLYSAKKVKPATRILISQLKASKFKIVFDSINIYYKGTKIDYDLLYYSNKDNIELDDQSFVFIDIGSYYLSDLTIELISDDLNCIDSLDISVLGSTDTVDLYDIYYVYNLSNVNNNRLMLTFADFSLRNPSFEDETIFSDMSDTEGYDVVDAIMEYRYKDKLYYFYNLEKEYIDGYYKYLDGYLKDEDDYKTYYRYRNRNKLEVASEIVIDKYNKSLDDFVTSTTDYKVDTNIDYYKNGTYYVKYITDFIEVEREVVVDIMENELRERLSDLGKQYDELVIKYDQLDDSYERSVRDYNELLSDYNLKVSEIEVLNKIYEDSVSLDSSKLNDMEDKYDEIGDNKVTSEYLSTDDDYITRIKKIEEEKNACILNLDNMSLRNEDNEKKLKLSDQVNDYLEHSLLDINNKEGISELNLMPFIILGLIVLILVIIYIKKKNSKNKF